MSSEYKCEFCDKIISKRGIMLHFTKSHFDKFTSSNKLVLHVLKLKYDNLSNKLIKLIIKDYKTMSILALVQKYNILYGDLLWLFEVKKVKIKGISETNKQQSVRSKYKNTCIDNFGVENVSQADEVKNKKATTFIEHYGVDNIFKADEFKVSINEIIYEKYGVKRITNYEKTKETNMNKYGVEHVFQIPGVVELIKETNLSRYGYENSSSSPEIKEKVKKTKDSWSDEKYNSFIDKLSKSQIERFKNPEVRKQASESGKKRWENLSDYEKNKTLFALHNTFISSIELRILSILKIMNEDYIHTFFIVNKSYDIYLEKYDLIIEINGDFWHANPIFYNRNDVLKFPKIHRTASEIWEKDKMKKELAENLGYNIFYIWENEINKATDDELIEIFLKEFEKCTLKKLKQ